MQIKLGIDDHVRVFSVAFYVTECYDIRIVQLHHRFVVTMFVASFSRQGSSFILGFGISRLFPAKPVRMKLFEEQIKSLKLDSIKIPLRKANKICPTEQSVDWKLLICVYLLGVLTKKLFILS